MRKKSANENGAQIIQSLTTDLARLGSILPEVQSQANQLATQIQAIQIQAQQPVTPQQPQPPVPGQPNAPIPATPPPPPAPGAEALNQAVEAQNAKFRTIQAQTPPSTAEKPLDPLSQKYLTALQGLQSFDFNGLWKKFEMVITLAGQQPKYASLVQSVIGFANQLVAVIENMKQTVMNPRADMF